MDQSDSPSMTAHPEAPYLITYVRVAGNWAYLYRAVDSGGDTIDFMLSPKRDLTAEALPALSSRAKILNRPSEASVNGSLKALRRQVFYDGASTCATPSIAPDF